MQNWLSRLGSALLALALAGLVWVIAVREDYPQRMFSQPIPVSRSGLSENLIVFGDILNEVRIEIRAPKARWNNLQARDFTAWVDLSSLEAGEYDVPGAGAFARPAGAGDRGRPAADPGAARRAQREERAGAGERPGRAGVWLQLADAGRHADPRAGFRLRAAGGPGRVGRRGHVPAGRARRGGAQPARDGPQRLGRQRGLCDRHARGTSTSPCPWCSCPATASCRCSWSRRGSRPRATRSARCRPTRSW